MLTTKIVSNVKCRPIPPVREVDTRPIKGYETIQELFANSVLFGPKKKGKTSAIYTILKRCAGRDTHVIAFVSTLNNDDGWLGIQKYCEDKHIRFSGFTSVFDEEGDDQVKTLVHHLEKKAAEAKAAADEADTPAPQPHRERFRCQPAETKDEAGPAAPRRPTKYRAPDYILIFDDLADELKTKSIATMLKKNRHFRFKSIVSSQWLNDLPPEALRQMQVVCLFAGQSEDKLKEIHGKVGLGITLKQFTALYKDATSEPFGFLYIDTQSGTYRKNFNEEFEI